MKKLVFLLTLLPVLFLSCGGEKMSVKEMLELSGRDLLPTQADFPDDGAVVLYENNFTKMYLDSNWDLVNEFTYHVAYAYFSDKSKDLLSQKIGLDSDSKLIEFSAKTIKPSGEVIVLGEKDLYRASSQSGISFTDDQSVKFTFKGAQPGDILEFSFKVKLYKYLVGLDTWHIQRNIPVLYTKYAVEIPTRFANVYNWIWRSKPINVDVGPPERSKNILNQDSNKDRSNIYSWEKKNVPPLFDEPFSPPYRNVAQSMLVGLTEDNWNKFSEKYWNRVSTHFQPTAAIETLAASLVTEDMTEMDKIAAVFEYTQTNYRYVIDDMGATGYIPHFPDKILENKYGDCKDMTVLNVTLLKALGVEAYPVLVRTRNLGHLFRDLVSNNFNHMITYVKAKDGSEYWLDATGSSCPVDEVYSANEGVYALILFPDGKSGFKKIPESKSKDNVLRRDIEYTIDKDGHINGTARFNYTGNKNISIRSTLKDGSASDMLKTFSRYLNSYAPDIKLDSLKYDDPSEIASEFNVSFHFTKENFGSKAGDILIFKPSIFSISADLDVFQDEERKYPLFFSSPHRVVDNVKIKTDNAMYKVKSVPENIKDKNNYVSFSTVASAYSDGTARYRREYQLKKRDIPAAAYQKYRSVEKAIAKAANENVVLERK
jgi:transglutaminase-like putative cysteine protease